MNIFGYKLKKDKCPVRILLIRHGSRRHDGEDAVTSLLGLDFLTQHQVNMIITFMSLTIALVSGLDGLHQWRTTWREYSKAIVQLTALIGLWEVKVANARQLTNRAEISKALGDATEELLSKVEAITLAEMDTFFSARSATPKTAEVGSSGKEP
jgi:hypothetical protein